ncbi:MAG TPA: YtxH domain-containing protein [Pseudogracilibacillus sp.]|nr:YtxH domain-containing protein [Pseudogracilibacillus sp.]
MGKSKLITGIAVGAAVGGLVSLLSKDTREHVKEVSGKVLDKASYITSNPDVAVNKARQLVNSANHFVTDNTESALSALDQVDNTVQKFLK